MRKTPAALPDSMLDLIWILLFFFLMISTIKDDKPETVLVERVAVADGTPLATPTEERSVRLTLADDDTWMLDEDRVDLASLSGRLQTERNRGVAVLLVDVSPATSAKSLLTAQDIARSAGLQVLIARAAPERAHNEAQP